MKKKQKVAGARKKTKVRRKKEKTPQEIEDETLVLHTSGGEMPEVPDRRKNGTKKAA